MLESTELYLLILTGIFFIAAFSILLKAMIEPYLLELNIVRMSVNIDNRQSDKSPDIKIAFFSDLHDKGCKVNPQKLILTIMSESPDLIIFGGDLCLHNKPAKKGMHILKMISDEAQSHGIPCYAVRGNHDIVMDARSFHATGFELIDDDYIIFETKDRVRFVIIGFNDSGKNPRVWSDMPKSIPKDIPTKNFIAISHNPDIVYKYKHSDFSYLISGHLHGGQIYLPFKIEHRLLRSDFLPREGIVKGVFEKNGIQGYISRGCGCVVVPLRLFSKPEVTHIHIIN